MVMYTWYSNVASSKLHLYYLTLVVLMLPDMNSLLLLLVNIYN